MSVACMSAVPACCCLTGPSPGNVCPITCCCAFDYRKAGYRRPTSAAVPGSMGDMVARPASLPVSHWSRHHPHHHARAHPHLRQDLMSTMHFSRPRSAQPRFSSHEREDGAAECISLYNNKHMQSDSPASSCAMLMQLQARHVDGLASSSHNIFQECSTAASNVAYQAPGDAAEAVCKQAGQVAVETCSQSGQAQHPETSCLLESSSYALHLEPSSVGVNRQEATSMERSSLPSDHSSISQGWEQRHVGVRASSHRSSPRVAVTPQVALTPKVRVREQEWPAQAAGWRSATLYKLQAIPMHLPTAKVCSACHGLCFMCQTMQLLSWLVLDVCVCCEQAVASS